MNLENNMVPVFIIVHNQLESLKKSLKSYESYINSPKQFIFHNANSKYQPTLDFLDSRERQGDIVYHSSNGRGVPHRPAFGHKKMPGPDIVDTIQDYISTRPSIEYIILTDPDVELYNTHINLIETYIYLLNKYNVYAVGPSLIIDDIPDFYPKKHLVYKEQGRFHKSPRISENFMGCEFEITKAAIDTTFQIIRAKNIDRNFPHYNCIRVFEPYSAKHLDWYIDPNNMTDCQAYCSNNASKVSHWNNPKWSLK